MNLNRLTFEHDGHTVSVTGYHSPAYDGGRDEPSTPEHFWVMSVAISQQADPEDPVEASALDRDDLEDAALLAWKDRAAVERDQYFDMVREERRLEMRSVA